MLVRFRILFILSPGLDFIKEIRGCWSGSGFYPFLSPGLDFIHQVRVNKCSWNNTRQMVECENKEKDQNGSRAYRVPLLDIRTYVLIVAD